MTTNDMTNMNTNKYVIEAEQISKRYREGKISLEVLKGIDLRVSSGDQIAIIGSSGSGKSTLMHILGGLDTPSAGTVKVNGTSIFSTNDSRRCDIRNRYLGFVYQFHHLLPEFSAIENISMPLLIRGLSPEKAQLRAIEMLDKVGLKKRGLHKPGEMSGGERQRVAIARALVTNPKCILADEPTGNLDKKTADNVYAIMLELNKELDTSFIIVTHEPALAEKMDKIYRIDEGLLIEG